MNLISLMNATLVTACTLVGQDAVKTQAPEFTGWAFILEADLEAGRGAGHILEGTEDQQALEQLAAALRARLVGSGKFVEGQVAVEEGRRLSVTFVGRLGETYDEFLEAGLTNPGRLVVYAPAGEADLAAQEGALAAERARLDAWRLENPSVPLSAYDGVPGELGGSLAGLVWRAERGSGEPVALLASTARPVVRFDAGFKFRLVYEDEAPVGFRFSIGEESLAEYTAYMQAHVGRELVCVLNGAVTSRFVPEAEWDGMLGVSGGLTMAEVRAFLFAFSGEPLCAPLRFVEFAKRPLLNVRTDGEDPDVVPVPLPE